MSAKYQILGADYVEHNIQQDDKTVQLPTTGDTRDSIEILRNQFGLPKAQGNSIEIVESIPESSFNDNAAFDHDGERPEYSLPNNLSQTRSNLDN